MAAGKRTLLRYIRRLVVSPPADESSDAALLTRFLAASDQQAFAALVERHGPMVLHVCQRVLSNLHDAEDAFQATFLVLARKATTVCPRQALPAWLHGVARRVALKARAARARRWRETHAAAHPVADDPRPDPLAELSARELLLVVDEEVHRLPEVYRLPVLLCCLEGRTVEEAARQLGWTQGSVKGRLERGRARLRARLLRRGLGLATVLAASEASRAAAAPALVAWLIARTTRGALAFAAQATGGVDGISTGAAKLAAETVSGMALAKLKAAAGLLLAACLLATGLVFYRAAPTPGVMEPAAVVPNATPTPRNTPDDPVQVSGRVLDPAGRPFVGARLYVGYSARGPAAAHVQQEPVYRLRARSATDGRFQFSFARSELDARRLDDARPAVIGVADGYGPEWAALDEHAELAELNLTLIEDRPLEGRILNEKRVPVSGARILVRQILADTQSGMTRYLQGTGDTWLPRIWQGAVPGRPAAIATDAEGRFRLEGLGRDRLVSLMLEGPGIAHRWLTAVTRPAGAAPFFAGIQGAHFEYVATAGRTLRGLVRDKANGIPVAGVRISAGRTWESALTDAQGRFELPGCPVTPDGYLVRAEPPGGQPYFAATVRVPANHDNAREMVRLDLLSGIRLRGRVLDESTWRPPAQARVEYYPLFRSAAAAQLTNEASMPVSSAVVQPDGSYGLAVLPGPGVVLVTASPRDAYLASLVDERALAALFQDGRDHGGGRRLYTAAGGKPGFLCVDHYSGLALLNPNVETKALVVDLTVRPARTLAGRILGPQEEPLSGVTVLGLAVIPESEVLSSAAFTVTGLGPERPRELLFLHRDRQLGELLRLRGDETEPLVVRLEPLGTIRGRIIDRRGRPVSGVSVSFQVHAGNGMNVRAETDLEGQFRGALVPGQKYALSLSVPRRLLGEVDALEVGSGRSKDLGDLVLDDEGTPGERRAAP
jgi:RNA polymerase sigma factor (sigma-70 family)